MDYVCKAFPQELPALSPASEYLIDTASRPPYRLSAWDLSNGHALASNTDRQIACSTVHSAVSDTEVGNICAVSEAPWYLLPPDGPRSPSLPVADEQ